MLQAIELQERVGQFVARKRLARGILRDFDLQKLFCALALDDAARDRMPAEPFGGFEPTLSCDQSVVRCYHKRMEQPMAPHAIHEAGDIAVVAAQAAAGGNIGQRHVDDR